MSMIWRQAAGTALGVLIGLGAGAVMYARAAPKQEAPTVGVIRAHRLEIVDEKGNVIGSFGTESGEGNDKMASLIIKNPSAANIKPGDHPTEIPPFSMVTLGVLPGGRAALMMVSSTATARQGQSTKSDKPKMVLLGFMGEEGTPTLKLSDDPEDKKIRIVKP